MPQHRVPHRHGDGGTVFTTGEPRTKPSVGFMATARTMKSPICWATSQMIVSRCPRAPAPATEGSVDLREVVRRELHVDHRPDDPDHPPRRGLVAAPSLVVCHAAHAPSDAALAAAARASAPPTISLISVVISTLPGLVRHPGERLDDVLRVVRRRLHGPLPRGVLRARRLQERGEHPGTTYRGRRSKDGLRIRLEQVQGIRAGLLHLHLLDDHRRNCRASARCTSAET